MPEFRNLHILLVNNYNIYGGIPQLTCMIANAMVQRGHRVTIFNRKPVSKPAVPFCRFGYALKRLSTPPGAVLLLPNGSNFLRDMYPLHPEVNVEFYNFTDNNLKIQELRRVLRKLDPDVCLPMFGDVQQLVWAVTLLGSGIPYLYTELCAPKIIEEEFWSRKGRLAAMSGADRIHLLLPSFVDSVPDFLREKVRVIPIAIPAVHGQADVQGDSDRPKRLLWLARMDAIKQGHLAMKAFELIAQEFPNWELHMVGTGEAFASATRLRRALACRNRIILHGHVVNAGCHYRDAQIFCISSRSEGMPTVLLEAFAWGLPTVGFAECDGVRELIRHGENGLLASPMTPYALSQAFATLMDDAALRQHMQENLLSMRAAYHSDAIMSQWEKLFLETAECKGNTVMDSFTEEPFASQARLSSVVRREWLYRDFGVPMPGSFLPRIRPLVAGIQRFLRIKRK